METASAVCSECGRRVRIIRNIKKTNHILHLILSIITGGIWIPVWIFVHCFGASAENPDWYCSVCGTNLGGGSSGWGTIGATVSKKPIGFER